MTGVWLTDTEQQAWRAYLRGSRLLAAKLDQDLRPLGLTLSEYEVLSMLSEAPDRTMRMSALADLVVQSRSRVSHTAARLEERGWVTRHACKDDKRGVYLSLAATGFDFLRETAPAHAASVREHFVGRLSDTQIENLGQAMTTMANGME